MTEPERNEQRAHWKSELHFLRWIVGAIGGLSISMAVAIWRASEWVANTDNAVNALAETVQRSVRRIEDDLVAERATRETAIRAEQTAREAEIHLRRAQQERIGRLETAIARDDARLNSIEQGVTRILNWIDRQPGVRP